MNLIKLLFFLLLLSQPIFSQDLIVPIKGDSIHCYITKVKRDSVYYKTIVFDVIITNSLSQKDINYFEYNYFENFVSIEEEEVRKSKNILIDFAPGFGWSYRLGKLDPSFSKSDAKEYSNGIYFRGRIGVFIKKKVSTGLLLNFHKTNSRLPDFAGGINSKVNINFIGPYMWVQSKPFNKNLSISGMIAIGKLTYKESVTSFSSFGAQSFSVNESTLGLNLGTSLVLLFSEISNLTIDFNLLTGKIKNGNILNDFGSSVSSFDEENASTFSIGLTFRVLF